MDGLSLKNVNVNIQNESLDLVSVPETSKKYCLNCGEEISGNFCSNCGQPTSVPERISNKKFGKSVVMCFTRLSSAFFKTLVDLSYKPWEVIRNFIHGKQVSYSHPVTMLIQLTLVSTFLISFFESVLNINIYPPIEYQGGWFIQALKNSTVLRILWYTIPFIFAVYIAYWNHGSRRFSFSEYVIAALYLIISIRIFYFFTTPLNYIFFHNDETSVLTIGIIAICGLYFGFITIFKAFPIKSKWMAFRQALWFTFLCSIFFIIYFLVFDLIDDLLFGNDFNDWFQKNFID